jgi:hypothetical protein
MGELPRAPPSSMYTGAMHGAALPLTQQKQAGNANPDSLQLLCIENCPVPAADMHCSSLLPIQAELQRLAQCQHLHSKLLT